MLEKFLKGTYSFERQLGKNIVFSKDEIAIIHKRKAFWEKLVHIENLINLPYFSQINQSELNMLLGEKGFEAKENDDLKEWEAMDQAIRNKKYGSVDLPKFKWINPTTQKAEDDTPFINFFIPFIKYAKGRLDEQINKCGTRYLVNDNLQKDMVKILIGHLYKLCIRVLILELNVCREENQLQGENATERMEFYSNVILKDEQYWEGLLVEYPVMYRLISKGVNTEEWMGMTGKWYGRSCRLLEKLQRKESRVWEMIKVAICDDDIATTGKIEDMLCRIAKRNFIPIETEVFWEGEHLSEAVESMNNFDVIFLDIEMGQADGITVARKIRETDKNVLIIYVTSHESYMQESFSVRPFRFLVKPVEEKQIAGCLEAAYEEISSADSYFRYSYQRLNCKIPMRDILYFESKRRKVYIVTEKETFEFYGKLNEIEESLRASKGIFLRIHQSFLINYKHIKGLAYDFAVMDNEERLSISEDRRKLISKQYCAMEDTFYVGM